MRLAAGDAHVMLRDATEADFPAILALNEAHVEVLSPLDATLLARLHAEAASHRVVEEAGKVVAFLLAFREGAGYQSPNYRWFCEHYAKFLYVDRVVVAAHGGGIGTQLYRDAYALARREGVPFLTCEYDIDPPNPVSERFHARLGFREVGQAELGGRKTVSRQLLDVAQADTPLAAPHGETRTARC